MRHELDELKARMVGFFEDLSISKSIHAEVKADTPLSNSFFRIAVPVLLFGLSVAHAPVVADSVDDHVRQLAMPTSQTAEYKAFLNGYEHPPLVTLTQAKENEVDDHTMIDLGLTEITLSPDEERIENERSLAEIEMIDEFVQEQIAKQAHLMRHASRIP